jgi:serine/threonine-protein kinase
MATKICTRCGATLLADDLFCGECGAAQRPTPGAAARPATSPAQRPATTREVVTSSPIGHLPPGTVLQGRYEIVNRIGGGGMGNVYQASDRNLDHAARAVKEMMEMFSDPAQREKSVEDFRREAKLLAGLKHPSIPIIYDHFIEVGRYYLVMEFITGGDLASRQRLAGGRVPELAVALWASQICDVLEYLHQRHPPIIYRDLKPANLMVDPDSGRVMLIDFGIARTVAPMQKGVTAIGTMGYAPPELFSGNVEPASDIYSLGATMFDLLTGADPRDKPLLIFDFSKNPRPREINPEITPPMEKILMRAVEYEPQHRYRSAREMKRTLEDHLRYLEQAPPPVMEQAQRIAFGPLGQRAPEAQPVPAPPPPVFAPEAPAPVPAPPASVPAAAPGLERVFCSHCGLQIGTDDVFCAHCGAQQPTSLDWANVSAKLLVLDPASAEVRGTFALNRQTSLIGRTDPVSGIFPEVDLSRYDPQSKVSRRHARIWREGDQYVIEDLSSVNGTVVNDTHPLSPKQPLGLKDGDVVRVGETRLLFRTN